MRARGLRGGFAGRSRILTRTPRTNSRLTPRRREVTGVIVVQERVISWMSVSAVETRDEGLSLVEGSMGFCGQGFLEG